ncbi:MAG: DUF2956 family protein [Gammaproteobacteria bacterium]
MEKGIEQYRKQQYARARESDKRPGKVDQQPTSPGANEIKVREMFVYRQRWPPWLLLVPGRLAMAACWYLC